MKDEKDAEVKNENKEDSKSLFLLVLISIDVVLYCISLHHNNRYHNTLQCIKLHYIPSHYITYYITLH